MTQIVPRAMSSWYAALSPRERLLVGVGGVLLLLAVLVFGAWQPLQARRSAELDRILRYDRMFVAVSQLPGTAQALADTRPIATILTQSTAAQGLAILRLDTPKPGTATVTLQDAAFDTLVLWIDGLDRDSDLAVTSAMIRRTEMPGIVSADLSLERAAP